MRGAGVTMALAALGALAAAGGSAAAQDPSPPASPAATAPVDSTLVADIDRFLETQRRRHGWPGAALAIARSGQVLLARGYGEGTVTGDPVTGRTPFPLGSVTKTLTALAVARLAQDGQIDLDAPVERYLPDFGMGGAFRPGSITVRHLLHHRSGLSQWSGHDPTAQRDGRFDHIATRGAAGEETEYSSLNYIILGRIVEAASGETYGAYLHRILFGPLGMDDAWVFDHDEPPADRVRGYRNLFGFDVAADEPEAPRHLVPAGFVAASARDMARYTGMLLGAGDFEGVRILEPGTVDALLSPMDSVGPAMAWGRSSGTGATVYGHAGNARTAAARVLLVPTRDYAVTLLVNANAGPLFAAPADVMDGVRTLLEGGTPRALWPKERLFKLLLLAGVLWSLVGAGRRALAWDRAGRPVGRPSGRGVVARLALDVAGTAFLLFVLPRLIGVPLRTLIEYFPDVGVGIALTAGLGLVAGVLRALTASAKAGRRPPPRRSPRSA